MNFNNYKILCIAYYSEVSSIFHRIWYDKLHFFKKNLDKIKIKINTHKMTTINITLFANGMNTLQENIRNSKRKVLLIILLAMIYGLNLKES